MARVICFRDGTREVLLHEDDPEEVYKQLEQILQERLGDEVAELLHQVTEADEDPEDELRGYETSCESYRDCLQDVQDKLHAALNLLAAPRLNRAKINAIIERTINQQRIIKELN